MPYNPKFGTEVMIGDTVWVEDGKAVVAGAIESIEIAQDPKTGQFQTILLISGKPFELKGSPNAQEKENNTAQMDLAERIRQLEGSWPGDFKTWEQENRLKRIKTQEAARRIVLD